MNLSFNFNHAFIFNGNRVSQCSIVNDVILKTVKWKQHQQSLRQLRSFLIHRIQDTVLEVFSMVWGVGFAVCSIYLRFFPLKRCQEYTVYAAGVTIGYRLILDDHAAYCISSLY